MDDQDTITVTENNTVAEDLPSEEVANKLVGIYFTTVQPLFPIIEKRHFLQEFQRHYEYYHSNQLHNYDRSFLCILNLVFALGQTYSDLINDWSEERNTHIEYFFRARVLGALDGGLVYKVGTLQQIQIMGLSGLYCLGTKQANRYLQLHHGSSYAKYFADSCLKPELGMQQAWPFALLKGWVFTFAMKLQL